MRSIAAIKVRHRYLQDRATLLDEKYAAEMAKRDDNRDKSLMRFLLQEKSIYQFVLSEINWILDEQNAEQKSI